MKKHVLFKAPVLTSSGYGVHARQIFKTLFDYAKNDDISLSVVPTKWGNTSWFLRDDLCDGLVRQVKNHCNNYNKHPDVTLQLLLPNEWTPVENAFNIGLTAGVETTELNKSWIDNVNLMNMVIVPSTHVKKTFENSGVIKQPLHVVPESFIDTLSDDFTYQSTFEFETKFNFLVVGQFTSDNSKLDRKNIVNTIKVILNSFGNDKDVGIILKLNSGRCTLIDRKITIDHIRRLLQQYRKSVNPRVYIIHGDLTDVEMASLYRHPSIRALVSLTRGEGFGLPILEAAAAGLPVIATNWSAYLDFMKNFIKINYALEQIPVERVDRHSDQGRNIWIDGAMWAQPNEQNAIKALKHFRISPEIPTQWASELATSIQADYCSANIHLLYKKILDGVLK